MYSTRKLQTNPPRSRDTRGGLNIDREKTCPFLIRVFWSENLPQDLEQFEKKESRTYENEMQIYTWKDANLREIVELVKSANQTAQNRDAKFIINSVYQDPKGEWRRKLLGEVHSVKRHNDDYLTLAQLKFQIADYIDLTIITNQL